MSTIHDVLSAARAMQAIQKQFEQAVKLMQFEQAANFQSRLTDSLTRIQNAESQITSMRRNLLDHQQATIANAIHLPSSSLALPAFDVSQSISAMPEANRRLLEARDSVARVSSNWQDMSDAVHELNLHRWTMIEAHVTKLHQLSALSFSSLQTIDLADIGQMFGLDDSVRKALADSHTNFGAEYRGFFTAMTQDHANFLEIPPALTELPAVEYLNQAALVASTSGRHTDEEVQEAISTIREEDANDAADDQLVELLNQVDPSLSKLLFGGRAAIESRHPDYVRHFAASHRELFTQVLHLLAPDNHVQAWTSDPHDYHEGRPTRRTRLRYITRNLHDVFGGFLDADVDTAVQFIGAFQKGTHSLEPGFTPGQILDLKSRMEGLIRFMLVVNAHHS